MANANEPAAILIVDDKPANLDALESILRDPDYRIVRAESGEDALRQLLREDFALVILDVRMPGMDGFECAKLMRSNHRFDATPLIFISATATDMEFIFKGYGVGGVDYVLKPFEPAVVKAKVAIFVELFRNRQFLKRQIAHLEELSSRLRQEIDEKAEILRRFQTKVSEAS